MKASFTTVTAIALAAFASRESMAASFDCRRASTPLETLICAESPLGKLDESLAANYRRVIRELPTGEADALKVDQRRWLRYRESACGLDRDARTLQPLTNYAPCIRDLYTERIQILQSRDSLTAFLTRRPDPLQHPNNIDLRRSKLAELFSSHSVQIDADFDRACRPMAAAFPSQKGIEHVAPVLVTSDYNKIVVRAQLARCAKVELRTPKLSSPPINQDYLALPTLALFEIDNTRKIYVFLDQSFHWEWSRAEGHTFVGAAIYRSINVAACAQSTLGENWVNCGGHQYTSMSDLENVDPIDCMHDLIRFEGNFFRYGVQKLGGALDRIAYQIAIQKLEDTDVPGFRHVCRFNLRDPREK